ncbi:MAG: hypothetical protein R3E50_14510 [Halioglobus sp.]
MADVGVKTINTLMAKSGMYSNLGLWTRPAPAFYDSVWVRVNIPASCSSRMNLGDEAGRDVLGAVSNPVSNEQIDIISSLQRAHPRHGPRPVCDARLRRGTTSAFSAAKGAQLPIDDESDEIEPDGTGGSPTWMSTKPKGTTPTSSWMKTPRSINTSEARAMKGLFRQTAWAMVLVAALASWARAAEEAPVSTTPIKGNLYLLQGKGGNVVVSIGDDGVLMIDDDYAEYADAYHEAQVTGRSRRPATLRDQHPLALRSCRHQRLPG